MTSAGAIPAEFREKSYRLRRFQNWMLVGFLYSLFYMTRYNFSSMGASLQEVFGWTNADLGLFETVLPLVYGISVVINAPIVDKWGGRKSFLFGSIGVVIASVAFAAFDLLVQVPAVCTGTGENFRVVTPAVFNIAADAKQMSMMMAAVWGINAYFQSFGALAIIKINAQWFHTRERGSFSAIFGVLIRLGLILGNSIAPMFANLMGWSAAFWLPACIVGLFFVLNLLFVVETPEAAGFATRDTGDAIIGDGGKVKVLDILKKIFTSRVMWTIALSSMMIGMIRRSVLDGSWVSVYYRDTHAITRADTLFHVSFWAIALTGIIGGFVFGNMSDKVFGSRRAPVVVMGFSGMILSLGLFFASDALGWGPAGAIVSFAVLSFFVNGAHGMIGGAASMDFGGRKGAATAAGLFDGMQYLAAALTAPAVAWITTNLDWQWWKLWAIPFAIIGVVVMATLWNVTPRGKSAGH